MKTSLESLLHEALRFEADAFDDDTQISGADLVEWFADWRQRARAAVHDARSGAIQRERVRHHLLSALRALRSARHCQDLSNALEQGGLQITDGEFRVMVFKRAIEEAPCQR